MLKKNDKIAIGAVAGGVLVLGSIGAINNKNEIPNDGAVTTTVSLTEIATIETDSITIITTVGETAASTTIITTVEEVITEAEKTEIIITVAPQTEEQQIATTPSNNGGDNHFNDYYNTEQQNTTEYVLNTSTMKIHYSSCNEVKKISPDNYSTTKDYDWAISNGYVACKKCNPH